MCRLIDAVDFDVSETSKKLGESTEQDARSVTQSLPSLPPQRQIW